MVKVKVTLNIDREAYKAFKIYCIHQNMTVSQMVEQLMKKDMKN